MQFKHFYATKECCWAPAGNLAKDRLMEIRNIEYFLADRQSNPSLSTFIVRMRTQEAVIQLQCNTRTPITEGTEIVAELLNDAKRQLAKLPEISSGADKIFLKKGLTARKAKLVAWRGFTSLRIPPSIK